MKRKQERKKETTRQATLLRDIDADIQTCIAAQIAYEPYTDYPEVVEEMRTLQSQVASLRAWKQTLRGEEVRLAA